MKIIHMSLDTFNSYYSQNDLSKIAIISFTQKLNIPITHNILILENIVEGNFRQNFSKYRHFNSNDAKTIFNFLENTYFTDIYCICDAGVCRSFSIALSLYYYFNLDYTNYLLNNIGLPDKNIITCMTNKYFSDKVFSIYKAKEKKSNLDNLFE